MSQAQTTNPCGIQGITFVEFASPEPDKLHRLFMAFGFSRTMMHVDKAVDLYEQGQIRFLLNRRPATHAQQFATAHGPSICAMGWTAANPMAAVQAAVARGGRVAGGDYQQNGEPVPAIYGVGDSLLYFVQNDAALWQRMGFMPLAAPELVAPKGFVAIDHLTNNVPKGEMAVWSTFYREIFGFTEVRYFDIRGAKTGLTSYALRSPDGSFCIPINEGTEAKSQINEYLEEYKGPGVQHLAFLTNDILASLRGLDHSGIEFLDIDADYYREVYDRVPNVSEDRAEIAQRNVLIDGDAEGYLLQIFTKNIIGPIFIEIIQRKNHLSFGEGNFGALFRSIERDQEKRGYLK